MVPFRDAPPFGFLSRLNVPCPRDALGAPAAPPFYDQANHSAEVGVPKMRCLTALLTCFHDRWSHRTWHSYYAAINASEVKRALILAAAGLPNISCGLLRCSSSDVAAFDFARSMWASHDDANCAKVSVSVRLRVEACFFLT